MPTLEELRSRHVVKGVPSPDDLIPYIDVDEVGNSIVKKTLVSNIGGGVSGDGSGITDKPAFLAAQGVNTFYASAFGASPSATASANVTALQAALDAANSAGGGIVVIDQAGTYLVNATLLIGDYTRLQGVPGVKLRKSGSNFAEVILNRGAVDGVRNYGIELADFAVDVNNNSSPISAANKQGLRGHISLFRVEDCLVENVHVSETLDTHAQFCFHLADWHNVRFRNVVGEGERDAVHLSKGSKGIFENGVSATDEDGFGINAHDYPETSPCIGNIEDVTIINHRHSSKTATPHGYFCRLLTGSWAAWGNGNTYVYGDACVSAGNVYRCLSGTLASPVTASAAPTHSSGDVTGADGITWRHDHVGTDTEANLIGVRWINCENLAGTWGRLEWSRVSQSRSVYPGTENNSYLKDISITGGANDSVTSDALIFGPGSLRDLTVVGLRTQNTTWLLSLDPDPAATVSTDARTAHTCKAVFSGCSFGTSTDKVFVVNRPNVTCNAVVSSSASAAGEVSTFGTGTCTIECDTLQVSRTELTGIPGQIIRTATGPQRFEWGKWVPAGQLHPVRWMLRTGNTGATGTAATASAEDSYVDLNAGTAAGNIAWSRYARTWNQHHAIVGQGFKFADPFTIIGSFSGQINAASGGRVRFVISGPDSPARADEPALTSAGIAIEFGTDGGNQAARLVWHDGTTYFEGSWVNFGIAPGSQRNFRWALSNLGNGTYYLWLVCGANAMTELPVEPSVTITTGPNGLGSNANRWVGYAAVARTDTAPTTNAIRVICYPSHLDFSKP
jgi:hypothetical protein